MSQSDPPRPPPPDAARPARCPACGALQPGILARDGRLWSGDNVVLSYVCAACGKSIHWGARGGGQTRRARRKAVPK